ncbi:uncharacterized protein LOC111074585 [Drosophila obscura]|uniref:uncharacterized protein LOC111074585 n=1 Tax=Drosophila obscura TaxID=7282 RepID=UPI000B9FD492|nr:uncharacterized protein LOC111074585 [Drosophila obscura]
MGNSGSSHQMNIQRQNRDPHAKNLSQQFRQSSHRNYDYAKSDIRSSPTPQRGHSQQWRKSYPTSNSQKLLHYKTDESVQFKVLPRIDKSLHLRATTNGAILNSGGTISGRRLSENPVSYPMNVPMQRSRTFIVESTNHSMQTEFTRSQTLHHVKANYKRDNLVSNTKSNLSQMQRHTYSEPELVKQNFNETAMNQSLARSEKKNKYTKKRRAPEVPTETMNIEAAVHPETAKKDNISTSIKIKNDQGRQTHFSKNTDRLTTVNKASNLSFKRKSAERNSVGGNCRPSVPMQRSKMTYRREKSSDAIIIRSKNAKEANVNTENIEDKKTHYKQNSHSIKESSMNSISNTKETKNASAPTPEVQNHRRTFYFGMDVNTSTETRQDSQDNNKVLQPINGFPPDPPAKNIVSNPITYNNEKNVISNEVTSLLFVPNYDIEYRKSTSQEDSVDDNGLRLCIRPTLPRRQLDTPSFSPALAWRSLFDDEVQIDRDMNIPSDPSSYLKTEKTELPIQPSYIYELRHARKVNNLQNPWTPEQDLCDQIDDRAGNLNTDSDSSSDDYRSKCEGEALLFYGSKSKISSHNSVSPLHTFSLSLPRDGHLQHARKLDNLKSNDVSIYKSLRKRKPEFFFSKRPVCGVTSLNAQTTGISVTKIDGFENWMLHKNVDKHAVCLNIIKDTDNRQELPVIEPQSLKKLAGGKHVMYLPGNNEKPSCNSDRGELETCKAKSSRHFKSRQRHVPENLQDKTPVYPISSVTETNLKFADKFHQRFTFHNPVRLLEKLYSDRSMKDTEDTENTHKSEVEALKRVEEDFQRNRANEKESIRHQLQLHFGLESKNKELYHSLPIPSILDSFSSIDINDTNNNTFCRDEPEGCASNTSPVGPEGDSC